MRFIQAAICVVILVTGSSAHAQATLSIEVQVPPPFVAGQIVPVRLMLSDLISEPAAGYQAFLEFDDTRLMVVNTFYLMNPFGLHILSPIPVGANTIDFAAGVNVFTGQAPVPVGSPPRSVAGMTFLMLEDSYCFPPLYFRDHGPPTRVTDPLGLEILPLTLRGETSGTTSDLDNNGVVDGFDLLMMLAQWGPCFDNEPCPADLNCDRIVNGFDLLILLSDWGPV